MAATSGKVFFGVGQSKKAVQEGKAKLVILADNCPDDFLRYQEKVRIYIYKGNNMSLGSACGKPFSVSALAIIEEGESEVLQIR